MILALFHCLLYQDPRNRIERERERRGRRTSSAAAALISQPQPPLPHPVTDRRTPPPALSLHPTCSSSGCTCEEIREDFTVATTSSVRRSPPPSATTQPSPSHPTGSASPRVISRGPPLHYISSAWLPPPPCEQGVVRRAGRRLQPPAAAAGESRDAALSTIAAPSQLMLL